MRNLARGALLTGLRYGELQALTAEIAEEGLRYFAALYETEREGRERKLDADGPSCPLSCPLFLALCQWVAHRCVLAQIVAIEYLDGCIELDGDGESGADHERLCLRVGAEYKRQEIYVLGYQRHWFGQGFGHHQGGHV